MSGILWLASYPKSGSTWLRIVLANLTNDQEDSVVINQLRTLGAASRNLFDDFAGCEASELRKEQIERLRPRVYERLAERLKESGESPLVKVHDAWTMTGEGEPLFSARAGRRAFYIIRNPLDVAVSYSHFSGSPVDRVIRRMGSEKTCLCRGGDRLHLQLRQRLLSWSSHVRSWVDSGLEVEVLRFEDMKREPLETFRRVARFAGLPDDPSSVERAVALSSFERLQAQEQTHGFSEKGRGKAFFRRGQIGSWRDELTKEQVEKIIADHGEVMERFGYLTQAGTLSSDDFEPVGQKGTRSELG